MTFGIEGLKAPPLTAEIWQAADGTALETLSLDDLPGRFKLLYFFQSWCPGCHSHGFPMLKKILQGTSRADLGAAVVQTVFEGFDENTSAKAFTLQKELSLGVPFGHDGTHQRSRLMEAYSTGGTPWFVLIAPDGTVMANAYQFDVDALIEAVCKTSQD